MMQKNNTTKRDFLTEQQVQGGPLLKREPQFQPSPLHLRWSVYHLSKFLRKPSCNRCDDHGMQIGAVSFVDEGVEKVLDVVQERGAVNTLFLTTFTYGRGLAGRQIPGQPFPDHGSQESDEKTFHGGNYAVPHPQYYKNTVLKNTRATEHGEFDILAAVIPEASKRGLKLFASVEDQWRLDVPGVKGCTEVDLAGRRTNTLCLFHPDVQAFWSAWSQIFASHIL
jgi:hypothetical protein